MLEIIETVNEICEDIELTETTSEQRKTFRNRYNTSVSPSGYAITEDNIIFQMRQGEFGSFEYYTGMEYERNEIVLKIITEEDLLIIYNRNDRAEEIIAMIDPDLLEYDEE